ncbi:MAG: hypothetical protein M1284_02430 [Candidatus Parvarchaeota archaeon]|nr:hypothetical protein [Candidatus Parvarchaeota archaeon]
MTSEESKSILNSIIKDLNSKNKGRLEELIESAEIDESTAYALKNLDKKYVYENYRTEGLERYLRSILDDWGGYPLFKNVAAGGKTGKKVLYDLLLSPVKLVSKVYDYILSKTNSHFISTVSMGLLGGEIGSIAAFTGETAYYSAALHIPFTSLFSEELVYNSSFFVQIPLITGLISALFVGVVVGATPLVFNHKKIETDEIEKDIKKYSGEFNAVFSRYNDSFFKSTIEPSLVNINSIYMLSSSKAYAEISGSEDNLRKYETAMLPYIAQVIKKEVNPRLIIHRSPKNVGGFTLVYNSLAGKLIKKKSYSPVFLNTDRLTAVPEYLFALFHEISHGAGATSEQMASYYAEKAMEEAQKDFPLQGYDLFLSVNKLESAVAALSQKFHSNTEFFSELDRLNLPRFVRESFDYGFNPLFSITFPVSESLYGGRIESKFSGLYASGPYLAKKMVEKGLVKTF